MADGDDIGAALACFPRSAWDGPSAGGLVGLARGRQWPRVDRGIIANTGARGSPTGPLLVGSMPPAPSGRVRHSGTGHHLAIRCRCSPTIPHTIRQFAWKGCFTQLHPRHAEAPRGPRGAPQARGLSVLQQSERSNAFGMGISRKARRGLAPVRLSPFPRGRLGGALAYATSPSLLTLFRL